MGMSAVRWVVLGKGEKGVTTRRRLTLGEEKKKKKKKNQKKQKHTHARKIWEHYTIS